MKMIRCAFVFSFLFLGCGRAVREGELVKVSFAVPSAPRLAWVARPASTCSLPTSRLIATSAKFGTFGTDMPATVDPSAAMAASPGTAVLSFDGNTSMTLPASDDWVFRYYGAYGPGTCTISGQAYLSYGYTKAAVMSDNVQIPVLIETIASSVHYMRTSGAGTAAGTVLVDDGNVKITVPASWASCLADLSIRLPDGTDLFAGGAITSVGLTYSSGYGVFNLNPLPLNADFTMVFNQSSPSTGTFEVSAKTDGASPPNLTTALAPVGFCQ